MSGVKDRVAEVLRQLERRGTRKRRDEYQPRYGIVAKKAFGTSISDIQKIGKAIGRDHQLALGLWRTGWYEARLLTAFIDELDQVTVAQMDRQAKQFDNWGVVDTVIFKLWDQSPHAWGRAAEWTRRKEEFVRRAGVVMYACLALHDKRATKAQLAKARKDVESVADDDRNFVRKGVIWARKALARRT